MLAHRQCLVAAFSLDGVDYEAELHVKREVTVEVGQVTRRAYDAAGRLIEYQWRGVLSGRWCSRRRAMVPRGHAEEAFRRACDAALRDALGKIAN